MNKMKELFESAVLTEETKVAIQEAFEHAVEAKATEMQAEYEIKLAEAEAKIPDMIEEAIAAELAVIAEEVINARTLEIQYAEKLTAFKESYAQKQEEQMKILIAESVAEEFEELKDDIEMAKKHEFVMSMFESFKATYEKLFGGADIDVYDELNEAKQELEQYKRKETLGRLLESVSGEKRAIAETILEGVATDKLEAKFESIRGVLLSESAVDVSNKPVEAEKSGRVILENEEQGKSQNTQLEDAHMDRLMKSLKIARR